MGIITFWDNCLIFRNHNFPAFVFKNSESNNSFAKVFFIGAFLELRRLCNWRLDTFVKYRNLDNCEWCSGNRSAGNRWYCTSFQQTGSAGTHDRQRRATRHERSLTILRRATRHELSLTILSLVCSCAVWLFSVCCVLPRPIALKEYELPPSQLNYLGATSTPSTMNWQIAFCLRFKMACVFP